MARYVENAPPKRQGAKTLSLFSSLRTTFYQGEPPKLPEPPFPDDRPSIYRALQARREAAGESYPLPPFELPDERRRTQEEAARWAPGALDGVMSHHMGIGEPGEGLEGLLETARRACRAPSVEAFLAVHAATPQDSALQVLDPFLEGLLADDPNLEAYVDLATWLATESPDREPAKLGVAMLGSLTGIDPEIFLTFGSHDEFGLVAAVALARREDTEEADRLLWLMARMTQGWGRVNAVERMSEQPPPEVARWLLREGFRNEIMTEYLAHPCATKGGLLAALSSQTVDQGLLLGAAEILDALVRGGPAPGMADYDDGAEAAARYLAVERSAQPGDLRRFMAMNTLREFAAGEPEDHAELEALGWTPGMRRRLVAEADDLMADPRWEAIVRRGLDSDDGVMFWHAAEIAPRYGIDVWAVRFARQREGRGDSQWWHLAETEDEARMAELVALFREQIDLAPLAGEPAMEMGLGTDWADAAALENIVRGLGWFPGLGWPLIETALKSPVIRSRNVAAQSLSEWPRDFWPAEAEPALKAAAQVEPEEGARVRMERVLAGLPPDEPPAAGSA